MKIAVITGASSGMGREFVLRLAGEQTFDEMWVIARRKDRLEALQPLLPNTRIRPLALDLTRRSLWRLTALCWRRKSRRLPFWSTPAGSANSGRSNRWILRRC